jgi:transcriptional regulator with XRE-family HTH domain
MLAMQWVKIKIRMLERGIYSQKDLAKRLGVNPSTITRLLKGQRKSRRLQQRIAELLDIPAGSDDPDSEK